MKSEIYTPAPDDWHGHMRFGALLLMIAKWVSQQFRRVVAMGNVPAVTTLEKALEYDQECNSATKPLGCTTLVSPRINRHTTPELVHAFCKAGFWRLKLYLEGTTTGAEDGVSNIALLFPIFEMMQQLNMVLQIHAEVPGTWRWADTAMREDLCLPLVYLIHQNFPKLRIVIEHVSSGRTIAFLQDVPPDIVAGTVTEQHLRDNANDVRGGLIDPHKVWKPEAKTRADQMIIGSAVYGGRMRNLFSGNDWAAHPISKKGPGLISSGGFHAPGLIPRLWGLFEKNADAERFARFTSFAGADFYQVPRNTDRLVLTRESWQVPISDGEGENEVVIYRGGEILDFKVQGFV